MKNKISVVIRTYNEIKHIKEVLESLKIQTYKDFEIIVIDSGSNDGTLDVLKNYNINLVNIDKEDFNYSYASNLGVLHSTGEIICFLSGHSVPVYDSYLEDINKIFQNSKIGACYGDVVALEDGSIYEKTYNYLGYIKNRLFKGTNEIQLETKIHPGIFSCSNAAARKKLLVSHPFKEELGTGGEDVEVAYRILKDGFFIAKVPSLLVKHSHSLNLNRFILQLKNWKTMYRNAINLIDGE